VPAISVLLPVRNARPWLLRSLDGLWQQSFRDFEVIAVDDGSSDGSAEMLEAAAERESRLRVVRTPGQGLPASLNLALRSSSAPIVARMDADDLVSRNRLAQQHAHLTAHPETAVVGSRVRLFPGSAVGAGMGRWITWHNALLTHEAMTREALIDSPLVHGTAMMRREWLERIGGWTSQPWPEDLDLWIRLIDAGARLDKCPETLYAWRQHPASATRRDPRYARAQFDALKLDTLERWLLGPDAAPHVLGVGTSLGRWYDMLAARYPRTRAIETRSPHPSLLATLVPPVVLVLVAYQRRDSWRRAMTDHGFRERRDFIFVA
jgi:glycosyltransferase involved in cell wall biosynthesis